MAAVVILSATTVATWLPGRADPASAAATTVNRVVLDDGFSGERGDDPDPGVWVFDGGRRDLARLDGDGRLLLTAALRTARTIEAGYGHAEARIRGIRAEGAWRALGVLDADGRVPYGRIDVLGSDRVGWDDFHTYAIDWTPTTLTWSLDGRKVLRLTPAEKGRPLAFVLNLSSGGFGTNLMLVDSVKISVRMSAPDWKTYTTYRAGQLVAYRNVIYRVREPHTALPGWQPNLVPALFAKV
ncbi:hypothetical protein MB27_13010 [Actinoplanes utahensis]|uniref:Uncharacterized protein n=2 Tax=Actinoplanes utahensis TaxID=1869 RepID=A0A0A6UNM9_ACTUT|nr:hypothetical protein MB27_13010 [Actinoplanes utahensis]